MFQSIIAIIPLIIRYKYVCPNCDKTHYRFINLKQVNFEVSLEIIDKLNSKYRFAIVIITILITIIITAYFYPQDSGDKIWNYFE